MQPILKSRRQPFHRSWPQDHAAFHHDDMMMVNGGKKGRNETCHFLLKELGRGEHLLFSFPDRKRSEVETKDLKHSMSLQPNPVTSHFYLSEDSQGIRFPTNFSIWLKGEGQKALTLKRCGCPEIFSVNGSFGEER